MTRAYLSLGSNLGEREAHLRAAVALLQREFELFALSGLWETEPWGQVRQPPFRNLALGLETELPIEAFFGRCQAIEQQLGRRKYGFWGARNIDIDLLFQDHERHISPQLTVPHPYWHQRLFVLEPLKEIAPLLNPGDRSLPFWIRRCRDGNVTEEVRRVGQLEGVELPVSPPLTHEELERQGLTLRGIVAVDARGGLARGGKIPWDVFEDRSFFLKKTRDGILCLGRKTAESLPETFDLRGRGLWILSRTWSSWGRFPEALIFHHPAEMRDVRTQKTVWICGGGEVYEQFLPLCSEVYLTRLWTDHHCDRRLDLSWQRHFPVTRLLTRNGRYGIRHYRRAEDLSGET